MPEASEILRAMPRYEDNPFVFAGRHGFTTFSYFQTALTSCLVATGGVTERWSLHDIRRTVRSELGDLGVEPRIGEQILADHRGGIEGVYNWANLERQMRHALELWADRPRGIVEGAERKVIPMKIPA